MEKKNNIILYFLALLLLGSCEKQRLLNVPVVSSQYVVNGLFSNNEPCRLELSKSQSLNDTNNVQDVSTAAIDLYENGRLIERLTYVPPVAGTFLGTYTGNFKKFVKGQRYSINISVNGNDPITAEDILPKADITISNIVGPVTSDSNRTYLNFDLSLQQQNTEKQYFHASLQQRWVRYDIVPGDSNLTYGPWFNKAVFPEQDPVAFIPTTSEPFSINIGGVPQGIMLDNLLFVNQQKSLRLVARNSKPQSSNLFLESRFILRSVSEHYFQYYFSSSQYLRTRSTPLSEPVIVHSNLKNALGNFSGYFSDTSTIMRTHY